MYLGDLNPCSKINCSQKLFPREKKELPEEKQPYRLNETLKDFVIGKGTNVSAIENETSKQQTNGQKNDYEKLVDSASQNKVIGSNIDDQIRKAVDNAVMTVENHMHDAILTAMDRW